LNYHTVSELIVLQSRLLNPSFHGDGRWIVFDVRNRRAFLATGKDQYPTLLDSLRRLSAQSSANLKIQVEAEELKFLLQLGLIRRSASPSMRVRSSNLHTLYHRATVDYPFLDYSAKDWLEQDQELMASYARVAPPPDNFTSRFGKAIPLPKFDFFAKPENWLENDGQITLDVIARVLRFAFGSYAEIPGGNYGPWLRKTSPSGGARHPTEAILYLPSGVIDSMSGSYYYDSSGHCLIRTDLSNFSREELLLPQDAVAIVIRSRVERPMWRYRGLRMLRPVLIDAGHVIETLAIFVEALGLSVEILRPPAPPLTHTRWLEEPSLATIVLRTNNVPAAWTPTQKTEETQLRLDRRLVTNPALWISFKNGKLVGHVSWPERREFELSRSDFLILNNCLPSKRGDRPDTQAQIKAKFSPVVSDRTLKNLIKRHALMTRTQALELYENMKPWVLHDWYLPCLTILESAASVPRENLQSRSRKLKMSGKDLKESIEALLKRKTTRAFDQGSIEISQLNHVLDNLHNAIRQWSISRRMLVYIAVLNVNGLSRSLYRSEVSPKKQLIKISNCPSRLDIRRVTSGQGAASSGAVAIWLVLKHKTLQQAYEGDHILLGAVGNHICLAATAENLGVFQTPAVQDSALTKMLHLTQAQRYNYYLFSIGRMHREKAK
jgi:SagB-type dehydrogenase family enzyme